MAISDKKTRIQITISEELKEQLKEKAESKNRSLSNYIVTILQKSLNKK